MSEHSTADSLPGNEQQRSRTAQPRQQLSHPTEWSTHPSPTDGLGQFLQHTAPAATVQQHVRLLGDARLAHPRYAQRRADLVLQLQRAYGNAYVQRVANLIREQQQQSQQAIPLQRAASPEEEREPLVQRTGSTVGQHISGVQASVPDDPFEQEAEQSANLVMRHIPSGSAAPVLPSPVPTRNTPGEQLAQRVQRSTENPVQQSAPVSGTAFTFLRAAEHYAEQAPPQRPRTPDHSAIAMLWRQARTGQETRSPLAILPASLISGTPLPVARLAKAGRGSEAEGQSLLPYGTGSGAAAMHPSSEAPALGCSGQILLQRVLTFKAANIKNKFTTIKINLLDDAAYCKELSGHLDSMETNKEYTIPSGKDAGGVLKSTDVEGDREKLDQQFQKIQKSSQDPKPASKLDKIRSGIQQDKDTAGEALFEKFWKHISEGEINKDGDPTGYHWKGLGDKAALEGISGTETALDQFGVYKQQVRSRKGAKVKTNESTFFPDDWKTADFKQFFTALNIKHQVAKKLLINGKNYEGMQLTITGDTCYPAYSG